MDDGTLSIRNFLLMVKKPMSRNFEQLCFIGPIMAMIWLKFQNSSIGHNDALSIILLTEVHPFEATSYEFFTLNSVF
jgi:hypothetical protein